MPPKIKLENLKDPGDTRQMATPTELKKSLMHFFHDKLINIGFRCDLCDAMIQITPKDIIVLINKNNDKTYFYNHCQRNAIKIPDNMLTDKLIEEINNSKEVKKQYIE